jgi:hypothetical protein
VNGIHGNVTVRRLFSYALQPLSLLLLVGAVEFLLAGCAVFVLQELRAQQTVAFMLATPAAEFCFWLLCFRPGRLL